MKLSFALLLALVQWSSAIPNSVFGGIANASSPFDGVDLTEPLIAALSGGELPGDWQDEASVADTESAYLLARPKVLGQEALLVRGLWRDDALQEIQITFNDAGSYFGYLSERAPDHLKPREKEEFLREKLSYRQAEFAELHGESLSEVKEQLAKYAVRGKGKSLRYGKSRAIRAEVLEYQGEGAWQGLAARLFHGPERLVRVTIGRSDALASSWMDPKVAEMDERSYRQWLQSRTTREKSSGDEGLVGMEIVPQGYRPYCGLNTLVMAGRYLGLHLDEDWLASAGKFQNTGSAAGSQMLSLYGSVASEAGVKMKRLNRFDETLVKRSLRSGLPVIVWRRWAQDRDRLHSRMSREFAETGDAEWGAITPEELPNEQAPLHASVLVGFNEERGEALFLESWSGLKKPRRMPLQELKETAYLTFCFQ